METQDTTSMRDFTGYYSLASTEQEKSFPQGAFLQIISTETPHNTYEISAISYSLYEKKPIVVERSNLIIDSEAKKIYISKFGVITLSKDNFGHSVSSFQGVIENNNVKGVNYLSPVPLEVFQGEYMEAHSNNSNDDINTLTIYKNTNNPFLLFDIQLDLGNGEVKTVIQYRYDPSMYLLEFNKNNAPLEPLQQADYSLMLGSNPIFGLACYVLVKGNPSKNQLLATMLIK